MERAQIPLKLETIPDGPPKSCAIIARRGEWVTDDTVRGNKPKSYPVPERLPYRLSGIPFAGVSRAVDSHGCSRPAQLGGAQSKSGTQKWLLAQGAGLVQRDSPGRAF